MKRLFHHQGNHDGQGIPDELVYCFAQLVTFDLGMSWRRFVGIVLKRNFILVTFDLNRCPYPGYGIDENKYQHDMNHFLDRGKVRDQENECLGDE